MEESAQQHTQQSSPKGKSDVEKKHNFLVGASIVQILLLIFIAFQVTDSDNSATITGGAVANLQPTGGSDLPTVPVDMKTLADDDAVKGDADAPVTIVEWSDFECPFCGRFYQDTLPQIEEQYIKTGKVKLVYRDFPLSFHQNAQKAAEAAECAGDQGQFWEMHDLLFNSGVSGGVTSFKLYAQQLGLNTETFASCLDSGKQAGEVQKDFIDGQRAGIQGTPGFIVNGQLISGAQPFSVFQQVLEAALRE